MKMIFRVILIGIFFHLVGCSAQRKGMNNENATRALSKTHRIQFLSHSGDIVDRSEYVLSVFDSNDSLMFKYVSTIDSVPLMNITINKVDSLPLIPDSEIVDSIQFELNSEKLKVYKYQPINSSDDIKSAIYWHKEFGIIAENNFTWDIRFILSEFDDLSFQELHHTLIQDNWLEVKNKNAR